MTHIKTIFSIFLLLCIAKPANAVSDDLKQWLNKLDESLEKAPMYEAEHEQHISAMKKLLTRHESLNKRFETLHSIYLPVIQSRLSHSLRLQEFDRGQTDEAQGL